MSELLKMVMDDEWTRERLLLIQKTCAIDATEAELAQFIWRAKVYGLDPLMGELVYQKYKSKEGPPKVAFITPRDGYLKVAQKDPNFIGLKSVTVKDGDFFEGDWQTGAIKYQPQAKPGARILGAVAVAFHKSKIPVVFWAPFDEYFAANSGSKTWQKYPSAMIMKVAEVGALRRQFNISGLVAQEEGMAANMVVPEQEEGYLPPLGIPTVPKAPEQQAGTTETQQPKHEETKPKQQQSATNRPEKLKAVEGDQLQLGEPPASETTTGEAVLTEQATPSAERTPKPENAEKELPNHAATGQESKPEDQYNGKQKLIAESPADQQQTATQKEGPVYELRGARVVQSPKSGTNALQLALMGPDNKIIQAYAKEGPIMDRVTGVVDQGQGTLVIVNLEMNGKIFEVKDIKLAPRAEGDRNAA